MTDTYCPHEGHLVWTDFDPRTGREQGGRRPALVLSDRSFFIATGFAIVCPVTRRVRPLPVQGEVLTSHVRSIDALMRPVRFTGASVPDEVIVDVRAKLAFLVGIDKGS